VGDDDDPVLGEARVELERRHADLERARERRERVLGREPARAAMPLEVEGGGLGRHGGSDQGRES